MKSGITEVCTVWSQSGNGVAEAEYVLRSSRMLPSLSRLTWSRQRGQSLL